jgi:hypothetical protein
MYAVPPLNDWLTPAAVYEKLPNEVTVSVPNGGGPPEAGPVGHWLVVVCCWKESVPEPTVRL